MFSHTEPIIDMHVHLWEQSAERDKSTLLAMLDRYPISWLGVMPLWGGHYPTAEAIRAGNRVASEFCKSTFGCCKFFVTVNPRHEEFAVEEIKRGAKETGAIAAKIWVGARADEPCTFTVAEACIEYDLPLVLHSFHKRVGQLAHEADAQHVAQLARRYPELKIVMAHLAGNHLWGCAQIADCPNVWSDISGSYCETGTVEHAIEMLGAERVLFGSDAPGAGFLNNLAKVEEAQITNEQRKLILYENAAQLFARSSS